MGLCNGLCRQPLDDDSFDDGFDADEYDDIDDLMDA